MAGLEFTLMLMVMIRSMSRSRGGAFVTIRADRAILMMEGLGAHMKLPKEHGHRNELQQPGSNRGLR
jgi:hypothetical protein